MSGLCSVCSSAIKHEVESITCSGSCKAVFHLKCANESSDSLKTRGSKKDWVCNSCKPKTPSMISEESMKVQEFLSKALSEFKNEICSELKNYGKQFEEFNISLQMFSAKIDESNKNMKTLTENYKELKKENQIMIAKNLELSKEVDDLKVRMRQMEQYSRKCNIEVQGIPVTANENPVAIAIDLGKALGVELKEEDVMAAHRVPTFRPKATPPLIAQLRDRRLKNAFTAAYKKKRDLTAKDVNQAFQVSRVYVNDHLTPETKNLLRLAKEKARELGHKYVWCNEGKIFVRKDDGQKCFRIDNEKDIQLIK